ncbi:MAG: hypothetical protein AXA67_06955 [Methylothermaceae bacteria B42]|nr:MAG: hypothetical protein AXA67_06955 [Methylothermaceae bacteria B42]HHJ40236.1 STAS domain-containing protein [Methylothermaceae bacterium]
MTSPSQPSNTATPRLVETGNGHFLVESDLTFFTAATLWKTSRKHLEKAPSSIVIDLSNVQRIDSAGLALLVEWLRMTKQFGKTLTYRQCPPQLDPIAQVYDLESLLPCNHG